MSIESRLAKLENQNRNLRRMLAAIVIAGAVCGAVGMQAPQPVEELKARHLLIVDGKGNPRIELIADENAARISVKGPAGFASIAAQLDRTTIGVASTSDQVEMAGGCMMGSSVKLGRGFASIFDKDMKTVIWKAP